MMKKLLCFVMALSFLFAMGCATKTLHCDGCNKEIEVKESSAMEEDWIIYCDECNEKLPDDAK